jgi:protein TonB
MSARLWILAVALSTCSHAAAAYWLSAYAAAAPAPVAPFELEIATVPIPVFSEPIAPIEPPRSHREPPQAQRRPAAIRQSVPDRPSLRPSAQRLRRVGVTPSPTVTSAGMALPTGATLAGELGTGESLGGVLDGQKQTLSAPAGERSGGRGGEFLPVYRVTTPPRMRERIDPIVPESFRSSGREAVVVVEVSIDISGRVVDASVVRGAGRELDQAALTAARGSRFEPAQRNGRPVAVRYQIPYRFRVRG